MSKPRYRSGAPWLTHEKAKLWGPVVEKAVSSAGTAKEQRQALVEMSKDVRCPTHAYFDWDDASAAEAHRLEQAAKLIRSIVIEVQIDPNYNPPSSRKTIQYVSVRAWPVLHNVLEETMDGKRGRSYYSSKAITGDEFLAQEWAELAWRDLLIFYERHKRTRQALGLRGVFEAIDKAIADVKRKAS